jgi:hypothetical protein
VIGSIFAVGLLVYGTFSLVDLLAHERTTEVASFDPVGTVVVDSDAGRVEVRTGDVAEITVRARVSEGFRATGVSREVVGDTLELRSTCPNLGGSWCSVDWEVEVPEGTVVRARADDGRAEAIGRFESVELSSENGNVAFDGSAGAIVATSDNGNVTVRAATAPDSVRATSDNGNVRVFVPDVAEGYRVEADSDQGSTDVAVRTDPNGARTIDARSDNGNVTVATVS